MATKTKTKGALAATSRRLKAERIPGTYDREWVIKYYKREAEEAYAFAVAAHDRSDAALREARAALLTAKHAMRCLSELEQCGCSPQKRARQISTRSKHVAPGKSHSAYQDS